jgi:hypothetical protein
MENDPLWGGQIYTAFNYRFSWLHETRSMPIVTWQLARSLQAAAF